MAIRKKFGGLFAAMLAFAVSACASTPPIGASPDIELTDLTSLPVPNDFAGYKVSPHQSLEISVFGAEQMTGTYFTDGSGSIQFPLLGNVALSGKTLPEASQILANRLRGEYIVNPQVQVRPKSEASTTISVGGEVTRPGTFPAQTSNSLIRAVNNAGGFQEFAKRDEVLVLREVSGTRYVGVFNLQDIARGNAIDPRLYPGDIVMVGDSPNLRMLDRFLQLVPALSSTVLIIDRIQN